jgi:predicted aspartyl protease
MVRRAFLLVSTLLCGPALHAQNVTRLDAVAGVPEIDKTSQAQDIRFRDANGDRMTVQVKLGGAGPYRFLVDTGADRSAVSSDLVSRLALTRTGSAELHSSSGVSTVKIARVPSLEFTQPSNKLIDAAVLEGANMGADGIVGVDVLRSQRVQFDFEKKTMTVVPSVEPDFRDEPGTIVVEARRKNGRLILTNAIANGQDVTVVLDTGSEICVGNEALRQRLMGRNLVDAREKVQLMSVTGQVISGDYMYIQDLRMGGVSLQNLAVVFVDAHTFKQLKLDKTPSLLLGMNAIRAFKKVSIDFANRKFRVVVPERTELEARMAMRGRS